VRTVSQQLGYTARGEKVISTPGLADIVKAYERLGLDPVGIRDRHGAPTPLGALLEGYFQYRAALLNAYVEPRLMDADRARQVFEELHARLKPSCPIPVNKQKGAMKAPAYLTGIVNMLIEANSDQLPCDYDPRQLTTFTRGRTPVRTLARRVDGAFPSPVNPVAIWEIKEYYYTTTFGSRVADGVYETLLDGMELEEMKEHEGIETRHYLMVDSRYTWWVCGKSYLCRIIDMLHMGILDEALFGYEVVERLPGLVREWVEIAGSYR